eukprot:2405190-Rhodomonas_salina.3
MLSCAYAMLSSYAPATECLVLTRAVQYNVRARYRKTCGVQYNCLVLTRATSCYAPTRGASGTDNVARVTRGLGSGRRAQGHTSTLRPMGELRYLLPLSPTAYNYLLLLSPTDIPYRYCLRYVLLLSPTALVASHIISGG